MAIIKKWFKYFDEARELEQKQLEDAFGGKLTEEELAKIIPPANKRFRLLDATLVLFSKENNCLIAKIYSDSEDNEVSVCLGIPYFFNFRFDLELKSAYYKKWFHYLYDIYFSYDTGIRIDRHQVNLSWMYKIHYYEPTLNEGKRFYKSWEEIIKGEKEVFEIKSKREPYRVIKSITVPYKEGYKSTILKMPFEKTPDVVADVDFIVREKLFVTRWKRWFPLFSKAFEVRAKGGPFVESDIEGYREVFSYEMGGDYLTPLDKCKIPEEAITYYVEELHQRLNKG